MFVQVIKAKITDAAEVDRLSERWEAELRPGADGFLGSTAGITADGTMINLVRFESREKAMSNSARPEQDAWWAEAETLLAGPVDFKESDDVLIMGDAASFDTAGFVQVIEGRARDVALLKETADETMAALAKHRPELLGAMFVFLPDGAFIEAAYFTSVEEARAGEQREMTDEATEQMERVTSTLSFETFYDLSAPRLS